MFRTLPPTTLALTSTLLAALITAGCATQAPGTTTAPVSVPGTWLHAPAAAASNPGQGEPADLARWWQALGDPLLSRLIEQALDPQSGNTDLRLAQSRLRQARAQFDATDANRYPSVEAGLQGSRSKSSAAATGTGAQRNSWSAGVDATWEADLFGARHSAAQAALADAQASAADVQATQVSLAAEVARNYIQWRSLQQRLAIARSSLASQTETWQIADWRMQAGLATSLDAEQARASMEQTRAQIPSLQSSAAQVEDSLAVLLGRPAAQLRADLLAGQNNAGGALPGVPARLTVGIPAAVLAQRPDVKAAERKLAAETARLAQAEAARYPSLTLSASLGAQALHLDDLAQGGAGTRSLLASLTAPLWNAGRIRSQIAVQDASVEQARIGLEAAIWSALGDVETALAALGHSGERQSALQQAAQAASNAALLARQRYAGGLIDFQTVLSTDRTELQAQDALASAQADHVLALVQLYKALGGGWSPDAATPSTSASDKP